MELARPEDLERLKKTLASGDLPTEKAYAARNYYIHECEVLYGTLPSAIDMIEITAALERGQRVRSQRSRPSRIKRFAMRFNPFMASGGVEVEYHEPKG